MIKSLPRSTPEQQGLPSAALLQFVDAIETAGIELHSLMALRHGHVVAEGSWKPYGAEKPHMLFSLSKSFTSTAVGFAVSEGLLSVDDLVIKFFPEYSDGLGRYWDRLKVRHLLSMSTGHKDDTTGFMVSRRDGDWVKGFFKRPLKFEPGTHFLYNTGATYMLSVIVQKVTGLRVLDYLTPRLFEPLGIEGAEWEQCPKGYNTGGFGLMLKTGDIARFGQFLLQRGQWEGKQLLPAAWVDEATSKHVENGNADGTSDWGMGYGYQFWRCIPGCYRGDGAFGQYCIVMPELDAVIAITSGIGDMQAPLKLLWDILLPKMGEPLPADDAARLALAGRLEALHYAPPVQQLSSPMEAQLSGKTFTLEKNSDHAKSIAFVFADHELTVTIRSNRRRNGTFGAATTAATANIIRYGRGAWIEGPNMTAHGPSNVAASFTWENDSVLLLTFRDVNAPFKVDYRVTFSGDEMEAIGKLNVSFGPTDVAPLKGIVK